MKALSHSHVCVAICKFCRCEKLTEGCNNCVRAVPLRALSGPQDRSRTWPPFIDIDGPGRHRLRRIKLWLTRDLSTVLPVGRLRNVALTGGEIHPAVCASSSQLDTESFL